MTLNDRVAFLLNLRGSATFGTQDADDLVLAVQTLKNEGHAITCDETFDSNKKFLDIRICHYLSCAACARRKPT